MGLDITWYRGLRRVEGTEGLDEYGEADYQAGYVTFYENDESFPDRADDVPPGRYHAEDEGDFRAGSYSGYNQWREELAELAGYPAVPYEMFGETRMLHAAGVWQDPQPGPFMEIIDFTDCDGYIGTAVARKLAKDFTDFQGKADALPAGWFREKYAEWRKAFEAASDNGAVKFH